MTHPIRFPGRRFQLWAYTVSHRQLLLRSNKSDQHASRCEILFKNVARIDLPTLVDDLEIDVVTGDRVPILTQELGAHELCDRVVYTVTGPNCSGYVVAGAVVCAEDEEEYDAPSSLFSAAGL